MSRFPEAELRYSFELKPDGSLGQLLSPTARRAMTTDARQTGPRPRPCAALADPLDPRPFEESAKGYAHSK